MNFKINSLVSLSIILTGLQVWGEAIEVTVKLSPVGSYVAKSDQVVGSLKMEGSKVLASNIKVPVKSLKTGIELRDQHTYERLHAEKFPEIVLKTGQGENGKGVGTIMINGVEKPVAGQYEKSGNSIVANFKVSLKEFGIEKIRYMGVGVKDEVMIKAIVPVAQK